MKTSRCQLDCDLGSRRCSKYTFP